METARFARGKYNASTYYHEGRKLETMVHGDDFVTTGSRENIHWLKKALEGRFEIKTTIVGNDKSESTEARILNRVVRRTDHGWEYEADQRHAEIIVQALGLNEAKGLSTPGEPDKPWILEQPDELLKADEASKYRSIVARVNFLAQDRADIQFATKEVCRDMSNPTDSSKRKLKRLGRYLLNKPRVVNLYPFQGETREIWGYSDSDWAGCKRTARSTSGGVMLIGDHSVKSWSSTQKSVTLSSAEAELVACVKTCTETVGLI